MRLADQHISMNLSDWPIEDLFAIPSEGYVDEAGVPTHCIFSRKLDAVTFVGPEEYAVLKARGIQEMPELPE